MSSQSLIFLIVALLFLISSDVRSYETSKGLTSILSRSYPNRVNFIWCSMNSFSRASSFGATLKFWSSDGYAVKPTI